MGGGVNFEPSGRTSDQSEGLFRNALQEAQNTSLAERVRNVFISFHTDDEAQVNLLRSQARNENFDMEFRDYSLKEPFDEKWKTNCKDRIAQTTATIVMIGSDTASREAVDWEVRESYKQGHIVIGVRIHRDENHPVPTSLKEHDAPIINWDLSKIRDLLGRGR